MTGNHCKYTIFTKLFDLPLKSSASSPGPNVIKLFTDVINECLYKARVFVPGKTFLSSLMFAS